MSLQALDLVLENHAIRYEVGSFEHSMRLRDCESVLFGLGEFAGWGI